MSRLRRNEHTPYWFLILVVIPAAVIVWPLVHSSKHHPTPAAPISVTTTTIVPGVYMVNGQPWLVDSHGRLIAPMGAICSAPGQPGC